MYNIQLVGFTFPLLFTFLIRSAVRRTCFERESITRVSTGPQCRAETRPEVHTPLAKEVGVMYGVQEERRGKGRRG